MQIADHLDKIIIASNCKNLSQFISHSFDIHYRQESE